MQLPEVVREKARVAGATAWLDALPELVASLERDWGIEVGRALDGGTEAFVAEARGPGGGAAVLKLAIPRDGDAARREIRVLRHADGRGCVRLLQADEARGALLLERLGRMLKELALPLARQHALLCDAVQQLWRCPSDPSLPSGAEKGRWLIDCIRARWDRLDRPCSERAVGHALACAARRIAAHDDERAVLVHGDVHAWNALEAQPGFKLIDPDGLHAEPEYDLGILMREDPLELMQGDPRARARRLARRTGLDAEAIGEGGVVERVSTGLLCSEIGLQPVAREMLAAADRVAETSP